MVEKGKKTMFRRLLITLAMPVTAFLIIFGFCSLQNQTVSAQAQQGCPTITIVAEEVIAASENFTPGLSVSGGIPNNMNACSVYRGIVDNANFTGDDVSNLTLTVKLNPASGLHIEFKDFACSEDLPGLIICPISQILDRDFLRSNITVTTGLTPTGIFTVNWSLSATGYETDTYNERVNLFPLPELSTQAMIETELQQGYVVTGERFVNVFVIHNTSVFTAFNVRATVIFTGLDVIGSTFPISCSSPVGHLKHKCTIREIAPGESYTMTAFNSMRNPGEFCEEIQIQPDNNPTDNEAHQCIEARPQPVGDLSLDLTTQPGDGTQAHPLKFNYSIQNTGETTVTARVIVTTTHALAIEARLDKGTCQTTQISDPDETYMYSVCSLEVLPIGASWIIEFDALLATDATESCSSGKALFFFDPLIQPDPTADNTARGCLEPTEQPAGMLFLSLISR